LGSTGSGATPPTAADQDTRGWYTEHMFSPSTRTWFEGAFPGPTEVQRRGWEAIGRGVHALLVAPTGSGKTLAAFLAGIDRLAIGPNDRKDGVRLLYISPLKALVYDIERNLRAPLAGIYRTAEQLAIPIPAIRVDVRTGDTPQRDRRRYARQPAEILVTTPESLFLILGSEARSTLARVETVIVDEVHALAPTKRGTHLAVSLERLAELTGRDPQRIGLSATVRPLDEIARFLGGDRPVEIVDASARPDLDILVTVPVPDMTRVEIPDAAEPVKAPADAGGPILAELAGELYDKKIHTPFTERGIWPAIYPQILSEITSNRSTIVFVNSRGLCERLARRLNDLAGEEIVRAHHGSVSQEKRREIEEGLKAGAIRGIVATSSLELGIDMGAVDRVILVESPGSVARGLQRVGRAGHHVGSVSIGRIYPKYRGDLLESAVIAGRMRDGEIESTDVPKNPLDVLAQQIVAICSERERSVDEIERLIRRAYPFRDLTAGVLVSVLDMLSGRYPSTDFADLRPLLSWDRARGTLRARRGAAMTSRMNAGTIPDRGHYAVHLVGGGPRVGELDEEMVFETRVGDRITLGASTWRIEQIERDRVLVAPSPGEVGRLPFWKGDGPGRPIEVGRAIGAFVRELARVPRESAVDWIRARTPLDPLAAQNLATYIFDQIDQTGTIPTDRVITIERFRDELGDWRVCILTPFGARVHAPWASAIRRRISRESGFETQTMYSEEGIVLRFADLGELPELGSLIPDPDEVEDLVTEQLPETALFASLFRENAVRSLLLPRRRPAQRNPLWVQRLKSQQLLANVRRYPAFPILLETYREALRDVFDVPSLKDVLRAIRMRAIHVREIETRTASPFARSLVFAYVTAYMYEQDSPLAERRAQALTVDKNLLAELIGPAELRELISPEAMAEVEAGLQRTADDRRARDADELHDILRRLGDLSMAEIRERSASDPSVWCEELRLSAQAGETMIAGESRWIAAEDAGLYRDALGAMPPLGMPSAFLDETERSLEQLVARFARNHGPFVASDPARRYGLRVAQVEPILRAMEREGTLVRGDIRPGGTEQDYCQIEVLRRIKRETLARLRNEVAAAHPSALAAFLPQWQGIGSRDLSPDRLRDALAQIEGVALPWSELIDVLLPQRVSGFTIDRLDMLCAAGTIVWVGRGSLGPRDGRVAIYLRENAPLLLDPVAEGPTEGISTGEIHERILQFLGERGASFQTEIADTVRRACPGSGTEFEGALWDLVWAGRITNDTFMPLQDFRWPARRAGARAKGRLRAPVGGGRWWRVDRLDQSEVPATERTLARARLLLGRYGIVTSEVAHAEGMPGGFAPLYKVLRAMEESGQIRRGYFVEGMGGAQFAHAGAIDRLRAGRGRADDDGGPRAASDIAILSSVDPANPYGALIPWPESVNPEAGRPRRVPGADVIMLNGRPILYVAPRGRGLLIFPHPDRPLEEILPIVLPALRQLPRRGGRPGRIRIEEIAGVPAEKSPYLGLMRRCGFEPSYRGLADTGEPALSGRRIEEES
jgi:ATP-dependent helicase Lhr and Lhr-like helicase